MKFKTQKENISFIQGVALMGQSLIVNQVLYLSLWYFLAVETN